MKKRGKQFIWFAMAAVLTAAVITGCKSREAVSAEGGGTGAASSRDGGSSKLVVAIQTSSFVTDYDKNYLTQYLEKKLNMKIEFYLLPAATDEVRTKVSLMAASNENLPDVLIVSNALTPETILQYGNNGIFLPLNKYTADGAKMPGYAAIPEADKKIMESAQTMADGNMYSLSQYEPETWNVTPYRMFINGTWLDKLGLQVPKTTDELETVLKEFHGKDPNGNGKQDEIGVYGYQSGGYGQNITAALMNSFEFWNGGSINGGLALGADGKTVIAPFTQEGWKKGLSYMNRLYKEDLLSPEIFTDDDTQFKAALNAENNVVGLTSMGSLSNYPDAKNNKNFMEMKMIAPLSGPDGRCYTPYTDYTPNQNLFILSNCKNVDLAVRFADEFYNPETSIVARFGEKGVDWTDDPQTLKGMTNAFVSGGLYDHVSLAYISNFWLEPAARTWHDIGPRYASLEDMNTVANGLTAYDPNDRTQLGDENYQMYYDKHPRCTLPILQYTVDEASGITEALSNIPSYVNQSMAEFITGARDIDTGWNTYLSELKGMGLDDWLLAAQAAYTRSAQ